MTMKKSKTLQHIAAVAVVLLALCLVFTVPVSATEGVTTDPTEAVAKIGNTYYTSLEAAINAAGDNAVINVAEGTIEESICIKNLQKSLTIDGVKDSTILTGGMYLHSNKASYTIAVKNITFQNYGLVIGGYKTVLIEGNEFNQINSKVSGSGSYSNGADAIATAYLASGAEVTIRDNSIDGAGVHGFSLPSGGGVKSVIVDGNVIKNVDESSIQISAKDAETITISNNKMETWGARAVRISTGASATVTMQNNNMMHTSSPEEFIKISGTTAAPSVSETTLNGVTAPETYTSGTTTHLIDLAAQIGETYYSSLQAAINAVQGGETIKMLGNRELYEQLQISNDKKFSIDMNGKTIFGEIEGDALVKISGEDTYVTISNGVIKNELPDNVAGTYQNKDAYGAHVTSQAKATFDSVTISAVIPEDKDTTDEEAGQSHALRIGEKSALSVHPSGNAQSGGEVTITGDSKVEGQFAIVIRGGNENGPTARLTIYDGLIASGASYGISGNGVNGDNTEITISGGTITGDNAGGIYHPQDGTLTITGGKIEGPVGLQFVGSGSLTIGGGEFIGNDQNPYDVATITPNKNGLVPSGAAVSIVKAKPETGYGDDPLTVSITGGKFKSAANDPIRIYGYNADTQKMADGISNFENKKVISGGVFNKEVNADYIAEGNAAVYNNGEDSATYPYAVVDEDVSVSIYTDPIEFSIYSEDVNSHTVTIKNTGYLPVTVTGITISPTTEKLTNTTVVSHELQVKGSTTFTLSWDKLPAGEYTVTISAKAVDGEQTTSTTIPVKVTEREPVTPPEDDNEGDEDEGTTTQPTERPSTGGATDTGSGNFAEYPRQADGTAGEISFGSSKDVKAVDLPEGVTGEVKLIAKSTHPAPEGKDTHKVFEINIPNYPTGKPATIKFEMTLSDIEAKGLTAADVCLYHFNKETGLWEKLPTTFKVVDGKVYFEAVTTGFSPFAIVFEEGAATPAAGADEPVTPPTETPDVPETPGTLPPVDTPETPEQPTESPAPILAVLAGLGVAVVLRRK